MNESNDFLKMNNYKTMSNHSNLQDFMMTNSFCNHCKRTFSSQFIKALSLSLCLSGTPFLSSMAQTTTYTINVVDKSVDQAMQSIEKVFGYRFFYNTTQVNTSRKVSLKDSYNNVTAALNDLFKGTNVNYKIQNKNIILSVVERDGKEIKVSGTVTDENGNPIIGANISEKGTTNGTITDLDGHFALTAKSNSELVVSFIGYSTQEINIKNRNFLNIKLKEDTELLDEVVVVGYGTAKKKDLTGAITSVNGNKLSSRRTTQLSSALQGAASGVMVTRNSGAPGSGSSIKIRGVTTIGTSDPLVIVDGVPGSIDQVNPSDVESLTVLKDAASASIYGSRAAAGVIVITTKRAKENDLHLNYNFEIGWEKATELPDFVGPQRYMEMANETRYNDNPKAGWNQNYAQDYIDNYMINNAKDPDAYPNQDWQRGILKSSAPRQTHAVDISGGSKIVRTKASIRYDDSEGLYANKNYSRILLKLNNDIRITKFLEAHLDVNLNRSKNVDPQINPLGPYRTNPSIYAIRWQNGKWASINGGGNVVALAQDGGNKKNWSTDVGGKFGLDIKPFKGLTISGVFAPRLHFSKVKSFRKMVPYHTPGDNPVVDGYIADFKTTMLSEARNDSYNMTTQFFANYNTKIGKHSMTAMVGYEDYYAFWEDLGASRDQYELSNYPYLDIGPKVLRDNSGNAREYAYRSLFGRLTYNYDNRYMAQVNFRRDGSSRFAPGNRWANFPSFSAGWNVSEEKWMKKFKNLSFLKLRGSWGRLGNERIGGLYPYQASLDFGSTLFYNGNNVASLSTAAQSVYAVHDISWETTETWDIGFDVMFFNSRLSLSADYYQKKTKDMLLPLEIPKFIGYSNPSVNAGQMSTKGFDLDVRWSDTKGDFSYSIGVNLSDFISKMGDMKGTQFIGDVIKEEGSEFNEWYGYVSDGLFQTQEEVDNAPKINNRVSVGDIRYKDISGPDGVPDGKISSEYDRVRLGGSLPRFMFGINPTFSWKGLDLSMVFQGVLKQNARIQRTMVEGLASNWRGFPAILEGKYWSEKNTPEQNAAAEYPRLSRNSMNNNMVMSDYWLFNGRYLRMKNITLGYTLPTKWTKLAGMNQVRFYVSGSDLFCLNKYPKGWDPEVSTTGYPITSSVLLGVSVNF